MLNLLMVENTIPLYYLKMDNYLDLVKMMKDNLVKLIQNKKNWDLFKNYPIALNLVKFIVLVILIMDWM